MLLRYVLFWERRSLLSFFFSSFQLVFGLCWTMMCERFLFFFFCFSAELQGSSLAFKRKWVSIAAHTKTGLAKKNFPVYHLVVGKIVTCIKSYVVYSLVFFSDKLCVRHTVSLCPESFLIFRNLDVSARITHAILRRKWERILCSGWKPPFWWKTCQQNCNRPYLCNDLSEHPPRPFLD